MLDRLGLDALPEPRIVVEIEREPRQRVRRVGNEEFLEIAQPEPLGADWRGHERQAGGHRIDDLSLIPAPKRSG